MTATEGRHLWVGDEVHDEIVGRGGLISDVEPDGRYLLRSGGIDWYAREPARLVLVRRREERGSA